MPITEQLDYSWKIAIGGAGAVGKTTFMLRYLTEKFISTTTMTVGVQFHSHTVEHAGKRIGMLFWDLAGQERFRFMHSSYMKGSVAALLFFDTTRVSTVFELAPWVEMVRAYATPNAPILLVGTKTDVIDESMRAFAVAEGNRIIEKHGLESLVLTSSKTGENIHAAIERLVDILLGRIPRYCLFKDEQASRPVTEATPLGSLYREASPTPVEPVAPAVAPLARALPSAEQVDVPLRRGGFWGFGRKKSSVFFE